VSIIYVSARGCVFVDVFTAFEKLAYNLKEKSNLLLTAPPLFVLSLL